MFTFKINYFILSILLFLVEVFIAVYVKDSFIRPFFGDFQAVIWLFCVFSTFLNLSVFKISTIVLIISFIIEGLQYIHFLKMVGLEKNKILSILLGTSFAWEDILAYTLGILFVHLTLFLKEKS